jgi:hypothetical protein
MFSEVENTLVNVLKKNYLPFWETVNFISFEHLEIELERIEIKVVWSYGYSTTAEEIEIWNKGSKIKTISAAGMNFVLLVKFFC